jgi:hypothetical protein
VSATFDGLKSTNFKGGIAKREDIKGELPGFGDFVTAAKEKLLVTSKTSP